jgi:hypothetical protein
MLKKTVYLLEIAVHFVGWSHKWRIDDAFKKNTHSAIVKHIRRKPRFGERISEINSEYMQFTQQDINVWNLNEDFVVHIYMSLQGTGRRNSTGAECQTARTYPDISFHVHLPPGLGISVILQCDGYWNVELNNYFGVGNVKIIIIRITIIPTDKLLSNKICLGIWSVKKK